MIPEKPTLSEVHPNKVRGDLHVTIPLEEGYSLQIEMFLDNPRITLVNARHQTVYHQPWRTDAIRNCMDAMVRDECATPKSS